MPTVPPSVVLRSPFAVFRSPGVVGSSLNKRFAPYTSWKMASTHRHGELQKGAVDTGDFDTSHDVASRNYLHSYGLVPPSVESYKVQAQRCLRQLALKTSPIEKYLYLSSLRNSNVHLFYRLAVDHMKEIMPLVYTPVVGEACQKWSEIYTQPEVSLLRFVHEICSGRSPYFHVIQLTPIARFNHQAIRKSLPIYQD